MMIQIQGFDIEEINGDNFKENEPLLSVYCLTYNHKKYISACLDGILKQKTTFDIEIIIFDDASNDGTTDIIKEYARNYPKIIHAFIAAENTYRKTGTLELETEIKSKIKGKYFAICEGDDYWIDSNKLQMQVDFLETHNDYMLTMHNAICMNNKTQKREIMRTDEISHEISPEELILQKSGIWPTASMVGKREVLFAEPFFFDCGIGDWPMQLYALAKGRIFYFERVMSVYRFMHPGSWSLNVRKKMSVLLKHNLKMIFFLEEYDKYTNYKYSQEILIRKQSFYVDSLGTYKMELEEYLGACEEVALEIEDKYRTITNKMKNLYRLYYEIDYLPEEVKEFISNNSKLYLYGTGYFGKKMASAMKKNKVEFEGFVVSDGQEKSEEFMDKRVYYISEMEKMNCSIIVCIDCMDGNKWLGLKQNIISNGIQKYINPFTINE